MSPALSPAAQRHSADLASERARSDALGNLNAAHNAITLALANAVRDGDGVGAAKALEAMKKAADQLFEVVA